MSNTGQNTMGAKQMLVVSMGSPQAPLASQSCGGLVLKWSSLVRPPWRDPPRKPPVKNMSLRLHFLI